MRTAICFAALLAAIAALTTAATASGGYSPGSSGKCTPGCRPTAVYGPHTCPWAHCRYAECYYWKHGKQYRGEECKPVVHDDKPVPEQEPEPVPEPVHKCEDKCYPKWRLAYTGCDDKYCKVQSCALRRGGWGFKCAYVDHKPVPEPEPVPEPVPAPTCAEKCYPKWAKAYKDCDKKYCKVTGCALRRKGWGFKCVYKVDKPEPVPEPVPEPKCEDKCYPKWGIAYAGCDAKHCKVRGCKLRGKGWGFRCAHKTDKPKPEPVPEPEPTYPRYCAGVCKSSKWRAAKRCHPVFCAVKRCRRSGRWGRKRGWACVVHKPSPSPSPSPYPQYPTYCPTSCRRNRRRVETECDPRACKVVNCRSGGKWWKWGYRCLPKKIKPAKRRCEDKCYRSWKRASKDCDRRRCKVKWCGSRKGYRCARH